MGFVATIQAILQLLPVIKQLLALFTQTPAQKRDALIVSLQEGFKKALESDDTSDLENIIRRGK